MKQTVTDLKDYNIHSYLTRDVPYYINQYEVRIAQIKKYTDNLEKINIDNVLFTNLSSFGDELDILYPNFIIMPTLFNLLIDSTPNTSSETITTSNTDTATATVTTDAKTNNTTTTTTEHKVV
jgi:hypothetical protein